MSPAVVVLGVPDRYIAQSAPAAILAALGLDGPGIAASVIRALEAAEEAARVLDQQGVSATVWDVRVVKPLDPVMIADAALHPLVVTVEDGVREGGAGTAIADAVGLTEGRPSPAVVVLGVPDRYIAQAAPAAILAALGLDGPGIAASVIRAMAAAEAIPERN